MNRKLRNTILAFSVTGMVLTVGLMAARPVLPHQPVPADMVATAAPTSAHPAPASPATKLAVVDLASQADAVSARIQARSDQYEAALIDARSIEQAVRLTVEFVTTVAGESLLATPLDTEVPAAASEDERPAGPSRSGRSVRSAIAMPYFSFARGAGDRS